MLTIRAAQGSHAQSVHSLHSGAFPADASLSRDIGIGFSARSATNTKEEIPLTIRQFERL